MQRERRHNIYIKVISLNIMVIKAETLLEQRIDHFQRWEETERYKLELEAQRRRAKDMNFPHQYLRRGIYGWQTYYAGGKENKWKYFWELRGDKEQVRKIIAEKYANLVRNTTNKTVTSTAYQVTVGENGMVQYIQINSPFNPQDSLEQSLRYFGHFFNNQYEKFVIEAINVDWGRRVGVHLKAYHPLDIKKSELLYECVWPKSIPSSNEFAMLERDFISILDSRLLQTKDTIHYAV